MIDPKKFPEEHAWVGPQGKGRRCKVKGCGEIWGEHYWPWDSRGG